MNAGENVRRADVTVVIPAHDRADVLPRALASVRAQTLAPAAVVVIDDGSSDATADVARQAGAVVLQNARALGAGEARNAGIRWATTRWVAFLDSDDEWLPEHLETLLAQAPGHAFVTSVLVDDFGRARGNAAGVTRRIRPEMLFFPENVVCTSTVVADRVALLQAGLFPTMDRAEDLGLWVQLLQVGPGLALGRATGIYHVPDQYVTAGLHRRNRAGIDAVLQAHAEAGWATPRLKGRVKSQGYWDDVRHAQHRRDWRALVVGLAHLGACPMAVPTVLATVAHRRHARAVSWSAALVREPS